MAGQGYRTEQAALLQSTIMQLVSLGRRGGLVRVQQLMIARECFHGSD
jgi:hypothetical protein